MFIIDKKKLTILRLHHVIVVISTVVGILSMCHW